MESFLISDEAQNISLREVTLLKRQKSAMDEYSNILITRIRLAKDLNKNSNNKSGAVDFLTEDSIE